ncbi:hypothetical protein [Undibacterium sp. TJN19]|uniref:hypothetical protein n=1 Tax=Undibacterium sp. TJN19 TaxID=3413055 RepID=UPI003BF56672
MFATLVMALFFGNAQAGIRVTFEQQNLSVQSGKPAQKGKSSYQAEIDGGSFRLVGKHVIESSDDDGASTMFDSQPGVRNKPLLPEAPGLTDPIAGTVEDQHIVIGKPVAGPQWQGQATRVYTVDMDYTVVARIAWLFKRRSVHHDHYDVTVADLDASTAAVRVALTRGYGRNLGLHPEAFLGFPIKIIAHLSTHEAADEAAESLTDFQLDAIGITPWSSL